MKFYKYFDLNSVAKKIFSNSIMSGKNAVTKINYLLNKVQMKEISHN